MRRERQFLEDIISAADAIANFIEQETCESFEERQMVRSAVVHELTVIGEAVATSLRNYAAAIPAFLGRISRDSGT